MAHILIAHSNPRHGYAFIMRRILGLGRDSQHEVIYHDSDAEALCAAKTTHFGVALLGHTNENIFDLDLAHALTLYDETLPLMLFAPYIPKEHEAAVAQFPFKAIFLMPFSPQDILESVDQYARV